MPSVLRNRDDEQRVTNAELFFDLVYVFAVTQLSHHLLHHDTVEGALQTLILLGLVWHAWAYTAWVTNWLDPARISVRLMLFVTALASLIVSAALPRAFESGGWVIAIAYLAMQVGRSAYVVVVVDGSLRRNFQRIAVWSCTSGAALLLGAAGSGHAREGWWAAAVVIDVIGGLAGFWAPGLGRSRTGEWTIEGSHIAERCQAFILIALGESVVVTGQTLSDVGDVTARIVVAFLLAFGGALSFWWIYFDRSADGAAEVISRSDDPGRLGRLAFHLIHPFMVAGIIVTAAADQLVLDDPGHASTATAWLVFGGTALFLAGHGAFKWAVWRVVPSTRIAAVVVLLALVPLGAHVSSITLGVLALVVVLAVIVSDQVRAGAAEPIGAPRA